MERLNANSSTVILIRRPNIFHNLWRWCSVPFLTATHHLLLQVRVCTSGCLQCSLAGLALLLLLLSIEFVLDLLLSFHRLPDRMAPEAALDQLGRKALLQLNTLAFAFLPATEASVPGLDDGGCRLQRLLLIPLLLFFQTLLDFLPANKATVCCLNSRGRPGLPVALCVLQIFLAVLSHKVATETGLNPYRRPFLLLHLLNLLLALAKPESSLDLGCSSHLKLLLHLLLTPFPHLLSQFAVFICPEIGLNPHSSLALKIFILVSIPVIAVKDRCLCQTYGLCLPQLHCSRLSEAQTHHALNLHRCDPLTCL
mmetsp:Transcript_61257/g.101223  ORF Transcript_61257/g.101223 Transcript_61257/m.101223 type:complete len:311 (+) Transcript_61257:931-1863(+)